MDKFNRVVVEYFDNFQEMADGECDPFSNYEVGFEDGIYFLLQHIHENKNMSEYDIQMLIEVIDPIGVTNLKTAYDNLLWAEAEEVTS